MTMKVLVALSGGVDSSVAAAELVRAGHHVVGVTMRLWGGDSDTGCCSVADVDDARHVAQQLDIDHLVFNFTEDFDAARRGAVRRRPPHRLDAQPVHRVQPPPQVRPPRRARRPARVRRDRHGPPRRIVEIGGARHVARGADAAKDQSYVVHVLDQRQLARTLFPVGHLTKAQVRDRAGALGLRTADKPDSQDVCFITHTGGRETFLGAPSPCARHAWSTRRAQLSVRSMRWSWSPSASAAASACRAAGRSGTSSTWTPAMHRWSRWSTRPRCSSIPSRSRIWCGAAHPSSEVLVQCSAHGAAMPATIDDGAVRWDAPQRIVAPGQSLVFYDRSDRYVVGAAVVAPGARRRAAVRN